MNRGWIPGVVAATIFLWGFAFIPLKRLTNAGHTDHPLSPESFLVLRFVPLLPLLGLLAGFYARRERRELVRADWPWMVAMGLLVIPGYHVPLNWALQTSLHTGLISLLLGASPVLTYVLAVALGQEEARAARTIGVFTAFAGLVLIFAEEAVVDRLASRQPPAADRLFSWAGAGLMLLSVLAWTLYTLIGRRIASRHDSRFLFGASGVAGTLVVLVAAPFLLEEGFLAEWRALTALDWAAWAYASLFSSFFAYWAWIVALTRYEASALASLGNLVPLVAHTAALLLVPGERREIGRWSYLLGAAAVLTGSFLVVWSPAPARAPPAAPPTPAAPAAPLVRPPRPE